MIRSGVPSYGGDKAKTKSAASQKSTEKARFQLSGEKDAMRHKEHKTRDRQQIAEAVESVKKGAYEGF